MKILLVCAAGMSTSLIVEKMKKAVKPEDGEVQILAAPVEQFENLVKDYDVVLLGPQIRFKKREFDKVAATYNVPLDIINTTDYGMVRGDKILQHAMSLVKK